jgi:hypothetical protein
MMLIDKVQLGAIPVVEHGPCWHEATDHYEILTVIFIEKYLVEFHAMS